MSLCCWIALGDVKTLTDLPQTDLLRTRRPIGLRFLSIRLSQKAQRASRRGKGASGVEHFGFLAPEHSRIATRATANETQLFASKKAM